MRYLCIKDHNIPYVKEGEIIDVSILDSHPFTILKRHDIVIGYMSINDYKFNDCFVELSLWRDIRINEILDDNFSGNSSADY